MYENDEQLRTRVKERVKDSTETLDRPGVRRAVARALAAEGVVCAPEVWARLVRDLVEDAYGPVTITVPGEVYPDLLEAVAMQISANAEKSPRDREALRLLLNLEDQLLEKKPWLTP